MRRVFAVFPQVAFDVERVVSIQQFADKDGDPHVQVTFDNNGFLNLPGALDDVLRRMEGALRVMEDRQ